MKHASRNKGYSLVELLGVVALIAILATIAIGGYSQFANSSKQSAADRNASILNSSIAQYNQSGGLMTAQVFRDSGGELPEIRAFCLLASRELGGPFVSPHQYPVISSIPDDYRVVFVGLNTSTPEELRRVSKTSSGYRNPELEEQIESGAVEAARFVTIGPGLPLPTGITAETPGIVAFSKSGNSPCSPHANSFSTPPPSSSHTVSLVVSPPEAGSVTGSGTYTHGTSLSYSTSINAGWQFSHWDGGLAGLPASGSFAVVGDISATAHFQRTTLAVALTAAPPEGGSVTGSGEYKYGDTLTFVAAPAPGFRFVGWEGGITAATPNGEMVVTTPINANARFEQENYTVTVLMGPGGNTIPTWGSKIYPAMSRFAIAATPTWSDAWDENRYRFAGYTLDPADVGGDPTAASFETAVTKSFTIRPNFVQAHFLRVSVNNPAWGSISSNGATLAENTNLEFSRGTAITLTATPVENVAKFIRWSDGVTSPTRTITMNSDTELTAEFSNMQTVTLNVRDENGNPVTGSHYLYGANLGTFQVEIGQPRAIAFIPANPSSGPMGARSYEFISVTGPVESSPRLGNERSYGVDMIYTPTSNASGDTITISVHTMTFTYFYNDSSEGYGSGSWRPGYAIAYKDEPVFEMVWAGSPPRRVERQTGWRQVPNGEAWVVNEVQYHLGPFGNPIYYTTGSNWNQLTVIRRAFSKTTPGTPVTSFSHTVPADEYRQHGSTSGLMSGNPFRVDRWGSWR